MPDIPQSALEPQLQRLVENAQAALAQGDFDYAVEVCGQILKRHRGCLAVRRLQREAQLKKSGGRNGLVARARGTVTGASLLLSANKTPVQQLEAAEKVLAVDPLNGAALRLLATAAGALDLPETAVFAWEALRAVRPRDTATLLGLGAAYLAANRASDAVAVADEVLSMRPQDDEALDLMRRASVAETMRQGNWSAAGDYRDKLRAEPAVAKPASRDTQRASEDAAVEEPVKDPALARERRWEAARARVEAHPHDPEARLALGEWYLENGDAPRAAAEFQQAHRNARTRIAAAIGLGRAFQDQRQWDLALAQFEEAKQALTAMDEAKKTVCYELGRCFEALGQAEAAMAEFKAVYRADVGFRDVARRVEAYYRAKADGH